MANLKEKFTSKDESGNVLELAVLRPNSAHNTKAQLVYNKALREALDGGAMFRRALEKHMRDQNLWDDEKQKGYDNCWKMINDGVEKLNKGGIKKSEAKEIAVSVRISRMLLNKLVSERNELDQNTAEGQAEQAQFSYLVATCTVYNDTGKPYFSSVEDYLNRGESEVALDAAAKMASMKYGIESDYQHKLPENQFLKKYGFVDENLRFVNAEGKWVDLTGHLVNENGERVNEAGELLDAENKKVHQGEPAPFLDDEEETAKEEVPSEEVSA